MLCVCVCVFQVFWSHKIEHNIFYILFFCCCWWVSFLFWTPLIFIVWTKNSTKCFKTEVTYMTSFICGTQKKLFWEFLFVVVVYGNQNFLVTNIPQYIFCYAIKKLNQVWSEVNVRKWWLNFHYWVNDLHVLLTENFPSLVSNQICPLPSKNVLK